MKITQLKINGITNPIGFDFGRISISWKVEDTKDKRQQNVKIIVATDEKMENIASSIEGATISSAGTKIENTALYKILLSGRSLGRRRRPCQERSRLF